MADLRKLKDDALEAAGKGNWRKATSCFADLEKSEPRDPSWSLKLGESLRKMGNDTEAMKAFTRAAAGYAKSDLLLKAIAVCKIILGIDPKHTHTQEMLTALYASQKQPTAEPAPPPKRTFQSPTVAAFPTVAEMCATQAAASTQVSRPSANPQPAAQPPLHQLRLAALVPGSRQSQNLPASGSSAAMEIPVEEEVAFASAPATHPHKSAGRRTMATFALPRTPFFSVLTPALMRMAIERVRLIQLPAGAVLFSRGDPGEDLFVVASGEVAVLVPQEVARLSEGDFFGEIALLADQPRTATVRATVDSQVLAFDRSLLGDLVAASPELLAVLLRFLRERLVATLAETSSLFSSFTGLERLSLATRFQFLEVDEGLRLIEEGARSAGLFVLLAGEAEAVADGRTVARLLPGEVFGEISLIAGQRSTAQVVALCKCFLLFLPRSDFTEVIMTHPQVLEYLSSLVETRTRAIGRLDIL